MFSFKRNERDLAHYACKFGKCAATFLGAAVARNYRTQSQTDFAVYSHLDGGWFCYLLRCNFPFLIYQSDPLKSDITLTVAK